uniref:Ig-like domain-containing protein n=1 Tax=Amphiprion ocellaris TaxID=80972 RepID=A0AAQ6ABJ0_AMPOC
MEVTALLRSLLLLLLVTFSCSQTHGTDFPQVDPDRQQHFEGDTLTVSCEGLNGLMGWRVMKRIKGNAGPCAANWETSTGSCTVEGAAAEYDSGEYWCEMGGQQRSNTVNVTVTGGSVVLESPVHPVMQGDNVTLSCMTKQMSSSFITEFYKDGFSIGRSLTGIISSQNLSRFGDGFYKCSISDVGESPESWLSVRVIPVVLESPDLPVMEGEAVTLHCKNKVTANVTADFYKDGHFIGSSSTGNMSIHSVSKSHQGQYKCIILGVGESQERWLSVRENTPKEAPVLIYLLIKTVCTSLSAMLLLLL